MSYIERGHRRTSGVDEIGTNICGLDELISDESKSQPRPRQPDAEFHGWLEF